MAGFSDDIRTGRRGRRPNNGNGGNGGDQTLADYRLRELERRMESLETTARSTNDTVIKIESKLSEVASKTFVVTIFAVTGGVALLTIVAHLLIRFFPTGA